MRLEECKPNQNVERNEKSEEKEKDETPRKLNLPKEKIVDWEDIFDKHRKELEEEESYRRERLAKGEKMTRSWELAAICKTFIRENSNKRE